MNDQAKNRIRITFPALLLMYLCRRRRPGGVAAHAKDHPVVSRYAGSTLTRRDNDGFKSYTLVVAVDDKGKTDEEVLKPLKVEGQVTRLAYENPPNRSATEIFANTAKDSRQEDSRFSSSARRRNAARLLPPAAGPG